jgi:hypothetical protein
MRRTVLMALALTLVSVSVGWIIASRSLPSDDQIREISIEELAKDNPFMASLLQQPLVKQVMDQILGDAQDRVRDRVVDESRDGMLWALAAVLVLNVGGVALIAVDHRRRTGHPIDEGQPASAGGPTAVG